MATCLGVSRGLVRHLAMAAGVPEVEDPCQVMFADLAGVAPLSEVADAVRFAENKFATRAVAQA